MCLNILIANETLKEVVRVIENGSAISQIPIMLNTKFLEMIPSKFLSWAHFELNLAKRSLLNSSLKQLTFDNLAFK